MRCSPPAPRQASNSEDDRIFCQSERYSKAHCGDNRKQQRCVDSDHSCTKAQSKSESGLSLRTGSQRGYRVLGTLRRSRSGFGLIARRWAAEGRWGRRAAHAATDTDSGRSRCGRRRDGQATCTSGQCLPQQRSASEARESEGSLSLSLAAAALNLVFLQFATRARPASDPRFP
jgi:hypothetical protein